MKLSVIVPSLTGSVPESLRCQVMGREDVELVVVTGVSPVGKARNEGLKRATGDYVAWVDADDEVTEDWWTEIAAVLERDKPDVLTIDAEYVGWRNRNDCVWGVRPHEVSALRLLRDVCRDMSRPSALWLYVTRRELWEGLSFDENATVGEDFLILPKVLRSTKSCAYVTKKLYRYFCNGESLVNAEGPRVEQEVMKYRFARIDSVPKSCQGAALWGAAVACYWVCSRAAVGSHAGSEELMGAAVSCRRFVCVHFGGLLCEGWNASDLSMKIRLEWLMRFGCVVLNFWALQRLRRRRVR